VTFNTPGQGAGSLVGGALEQSNVDMSQELTDLIVTQRTYAANGSSVRTADQMLQRTVQLKR
jgi:flagellar hook protein FlgE